MIKPRARDLGVPLQGKSGRYNAITDVERVTVGHTTIIEGDGQLIVGRGPVRTGVTAILPRGKIDDPVFAGWTCLNGNGEMTGTTWVEESGFLSGPIMITNTHSVGVVHDAVIDWIRQRKSLNSSKAGSPWSLPVVAETYDGQLNDIDGFHVKKEHVFKSIENSSTGPVAEGNVGGGTGMICHQFKGRHRDILQNCGDRCKHIHYWSIGAGQLWAPLASDCRRCTHWPGDQRPYARRKLNISTTR